MTGGLQALSTAQVPVALLSSSHPIPGLYAPSPKPLQLMSSLGSHSSIALLFWLSLLVPSLLVFFCLCLLSHSPYLFLPSSQVCWPCSIDGFFSLLWTPPGASGCALPRVYNRNLPLNHASKWSCPPFTHSPFCRARPQVLLYQKKKSIFKRYP